MRHVFLSVTLALRTLATGTDAAARPPADDYLHPQKPGARLVRAPFSGPGFRVHREHRAVPDFSIGDFSDNMSCLSNPSWNALYPVQDIPAGDWCAATNQPAQGDCHDALSVSFSTCQGVPIKDGTCAPL